MNNTDMAETYGSVRGLSGLTNIGNTCYMNTALQNVLHCPAFINYTISESFAYPLEFNIKKKLVEDEQKKNPNGDPIVYRSQISEDFKNTVTYNFFKLVRAFWNINRVVRHVVSKQLLVKKMKSFGV